MYGRQKRIFDTISGKWEGESNDEQTKKIDNISIVLFFTWLSYINTFTAITKWKTKELIPVNRNEFFFLIRINESMWLHSDTHPNRSMQKWKLIIVSIKLFVNVFQLKMKSELELTDLYRLEMEYEYFACFSINKHKTEESILCICNFSFM